jgi:hypothetical protein
VLSSNEPSRTRQPLLGARYTFRFGHVLGGDLAADLAALPACFSEELH